MRWFYRFILGLPALPQDITEIQHTLPELLNEQTGIQENLEIIEPLVFFLPWLALEPEGRIQLRRQINSWLRQAGQLENQPIVPSSPIPCSHPECPYRPKNGAVTPVNEAFSKDENFGDLEKSQDSRVINLIVGANKPPLDSFLNEVKKIGAKAGKINQIILVDNYILSSYSEDGDLFDCSKILIHFLNALHIDREADMRLLITPTPKNIESQNVSSKTEVIKKNVNKYFPKITLKRYKNNIPIHDRFYLVEGDKGKYGIYGPSLSGLISRSVVMVNELTSTDVKELYRILT